MGHKENAEEQRFQFESENPSIAKIKVIGIGGAGSNAVDGMCDHGLGNVQFYVLNTDLQALKMAKCPDKIQNREVMGSKIPYYVDILFKETKVNTH